MQLISMINMLYYTVLFDNTIPAADRAVIIKLIKRTNSTIDVIFDVSFQCVFGFQADLFYPIPLALKNPQFLYYLVLQLSLSL